MKHTGICASDASGHSNAAGDLPKPCAYWSDGVDGDTRATTIAKASANVRFKNYTPEHMASRGEPRQKPE
ncbi:uncharacterized protein MYCFIDRAFT_205288 [Pseudocercospora fijiensis CIRAD86]|uniref:Uncharacterized protein n=1 Tax=Pseudocercospora fijiensis (strain CIRAD86) TaxID=383855 RepID=M2ZF90_PSEFD|nr:uncharacterized protein MYCFIDRAFT_205288 [Pseudocercospora fijiensis CIRAD86]EME77769.1 hypothetical protein MYCFIDRAFT_205288 [Pseudocercospora fijiensis CIRAD86]